MTTKHYSDADGVYIGGFGDGAKPPAGAIERPAPPDGRAVWQGDAWTIPALPIEQERAAMECSPLQMRRALRMTDRKAAVDAYIASQPEDVQETWEFALVIRRTDPLMVAAIALLGTDEEGDDLFRLAMTL